MRDALSRIGGLVLAAALSAWACGGDGGSTGPSPTPTPTPTPTPPPAGMTITITSSGASPRALTVPAGSRVTFVNNNSQPHDMTSNPHPEHTDCPAINDVGFITPGQSKTTGNLNTPRTCGFHDHNRPSDTSLQGSIRIQ